MADYKNQIFYKSSDKMEELPDGSINLIVTSPPYFNIKDYSKDGHQDKSIADKKDGQIGDINNYKTFISSLLPIWRECHRVFVPNGKLVINAPLMPISKKELSTHYNRDIFNISSDIESSLLSNISDLHLFNLYIWNRINSSRDLVFGSYPYPTNFYSQNTSELICVYVKDGKPAKVSKDIKDRSRLTQQQWIEYTRQIWDIAIPGKNNIGFGKHSALMPEEIVRRCVRLFSFYGDMVLDPFAGSGTTLQVAYEEDRNYVGYEISEEYKPVIEEKLGSVEKITWDMEMGYREKNNTHAETETISHDIIEEIDFKIQEEIRELRKKEEKK